MRKSTIHYLLIIVFGIAICSMVVVAFYSIWAWSFIGLKITLSLVIVALVSAMLAELTDPSDKKSIQ